MCLARISPAGWSDRPTDPSQPAPVTWRDLLPFLLQPLPDGGDPFGLSPGETYAYDVPITTRTTGRPAPHDHRADQVGHLQHGSSPSNTSIGRPPGPPHAARPARTERRADAVMGHR